MAKKNKGKHAKAAKIPKSIGGVKLPKAVRKPAEALIAKASTDEGRRMIAAGLTMAAGALAARVQAPQRERDDPPAAPRAPEPPAAPLAPEAPAAPDVPVPPIPPRAPTPPADATPIIDPSAMVEAAGKAASAFIDGFLNRRR